MTNLNNKWLQMIISKDWCIYLYLNNQNKIIFMSFKCKSLNSAKMQVDWKENTIVHLHLWLILSRSIISFSLKKIEVQGPWDLLAMKISENGAHKMWGSIVVYVLDTV